jgi:hypothetical protein
VMLSVFSILGTLKHQQQWLRVYADVLGILTLGDLTAFILILAYQSSLNNMYGVAMAKSIDEALKTEDQTTLDAFNTLQSRLKCCGSNGNNPWENTFPYPHRKIALYYVLYTLSSR